jgi:ankyrin repeat protein
LIARGAQIDVHARVEGGETLLHYAAVGGLADLAGVLIARGAVVDARGSGDTTPLYLAAKQDRAEVAGVLIAHGADVNARTRKRYTPLSIAAEQGNPGVARVLLDQGADLRASDKDGITPLLRSMQALEAAHLLTSESPTAVDLRRQASLVGPRLEHERATMRQGNMRWSEVAVLLIDRGAEVNGAIPGSADSDTPLLIASTVGDAALAAALLAKGAAVNGAKGATETPLHSAIAESHEEVATLLVGAGADVDARNVSQRTPLHFVARFTRSAELAELLISKGADVRAKDKAGRTPMDFARDAGNDVVAEVLRRHGG